MRVLLVTSRYPLPAWRGNQVRAMEWLSALSGNDIRLVCPTAPRGASDRVPAEVESFSLSRIGQGVGLLRAAGSGKPFQEGLYDCGDARHTLAETIRQFSPDAVVVQMVRCGWAVETVLEVAPGAPIIFDAIDAMGIHFERAAVSSPFWFAPLQRNEAQRCRRRERWLSRSATATVAVSARDLEGLSVPDGKGRVIPVAGREVAVRDSPPSGQVVLLSGNLGYRPTVEGAVWFAHEVWPRVRAELPRARWILAGARPSSAVRRLSRLDGVEVHGDVADLGEFMSLAQVAVAPMHSGSGVPMKVLEAMAAGVPSVVHPWAADGLAPDAASVVAVAESADVWVDNVVRLLGDASAAKELGERGRLAWQRHYHPDVVAQQIRDVVTEAATGKR